MLLRRIAIALVLGAAVAGRAAAQDSVSALLRGSVARAYAPGARDPDFSRYGNDLARLYASHADAPVWLDGPRLAPAGRAAIDELLAADSHGLDPRDYDAGTLDSLARRLRWAPPTAADRAAFDVLLSVDLIRYLDDLRWGRLRPSSLPRPDGSAAGVNWAAAVSQAIAGDTVSKLVLAAVPQLTQYRNLRRALARYHRLAADSTLAPIPPGPPVRPGQPYPGIATLRRRLVALGDLAPEAATGDSVDRYAGALVEAVRRFQLRHGLAGDGVIGAATQAELNVPFARRIRQIELALERLRWLPPIGHQPFIVVNVPAFQLFTFDSTGGTGSPTLTMKVVVGRSLETRTPVLIAPLRSVEFQPYWNVPRSILLKEILPHLRRNPHYLRANDMELVTRSGDLAGDTVAPAILRGLARGELRVRQRPSPKNALGSIKFTLPNPAGIYLHGTPQPELFAQARRDFSHGCIRVEDPVQLAVWVLRDEPGWTRERVAAATMEPPSRVALTRAMPVVIFYTTAVAWPDGHVSFYPDIYDQDRPLVDAPVPGPNWP